MHILASIQHSTDLTESRVSFRPVSAVGDRTFTKAIRANKTSSEHRAHYPFTVGLLWLFCLICERALWFLKTFFSSLTDHLFLLLCAKKLTCIHLCEVTAISICVNPQRIKLPPVIQGTSTSHPCLCYCFPFLTLSNISELQFVFLTTQEYSALLLFFFLFLFLKGLLAQIQACVYIFISLWV